MSHNAENQLNLPVLVIAGPTASGKSALAVDVAQALCGEVINADSCQIYRGAPLLSACPSAEEKQKVPHHLYEIFSPEKNGNVVEWLDLAVAQIENCRFRQKLPIVTGGTGLYINNLVYGTTPVPKTSVSVRKDVDEKIAKEGLAALYAKLQDFDSETASRISSSDICRIRRAFEVYLETGRPLSSWHKVPLVQKLKNPRFVIIKLLPQKSELDKRCDIRFAKMMEAGALDEVKKIQALSLEKNSSILQIIGIRELELFLDGSLTLKQASALACLHSRQYAKRQRTWFSRQLKADVEITCCYDGQKEVLDKVINCVKKAL